MYWQEKKSRNLEVLSSPVLSCFSDFVPFPILSVFLFLRYTFLLLTLFLIPGIIMMVAYGLISLELYRGIKFDASQRKSSRGNNTF